MSEKTDLTLEQIAENEGLIYLLNQLFLDMVKEGDKEKRFDIHNDNWELIVETYHDSQSPPSLPSAGAKEEALVIIGYVTTADKNGSLDKAEQFITERLESFAHQAPQVSEEDAKKEAELRYPPQKGKHWVRTLREAKILAWAQCYKWLHNQGFRVNSPPTIGITDAEIKEWAKNDRTNIMSAFELKIRGAKWSRDKLTAKGEEEEAAESQKDYKFTCSECGTGFNTSHICKPI